MKEIPKTYEPHKYEDEIYKLWEQSGFFSPEANQPKAYNPKAEKFSIALPPPNVTGYLHIGHAVMLAIEDIFVRYHRMKGDETVWIPGTDHAAIATQEKVERELFEKEKKTRFDLGREVFVKRVEKFASDSHDKIVNQIKKIGASIDWSREAFTLDEKRSLAVRTAFKKMFDDGIIYRGNRIVNWDPKLKTTVSDDEIEWKTEKATFYYLQYGPFKIGTSRPETKFGDKYVVVHPKDKRYAKYKHGQKIELEWINGKVTATVIKDESIDMSFGSGAMTITPWHDGVDFEIAERHNLEKEQIIDFDGKLMPIAGEFVGMDIQEAREKIIAKLNKKKLIVETDNEYEHNLAINSRGGGIIEPQIKEQWFVSVNKEFKQKGKNTTLKKLMQESVRLKKIKIIPDYFEKIYFHWVDNLRDWCISRQIWYGHRIPVWYKNGKIHCDINPPEGLGWEQDPDTLDTWFSSGLWTFSTLGWPKKTKDLEKYHPTSLLETGYDILFFWVARMILMSTYLLQEIPFKEVYLHGLVRDEKGRKMSKSLGNAIDPLDVIKKFGTDAVRLSLVVGTTPGNDVKMNEEKIESYRNFVTKLWNIYRYSAVSGGGNLKFEEDIDKKDIQTLADKWIVSQINETMLIVASFMEYKEISLAQESLRRFTWNQLADWYLEIHKIEKNDKVLGYVLDKILKLWHPFTPFVTEKIWQDLYAGRKMLMVEKWPVGDEKLIDKKAEAEFEDLQEIITKIRNLRSSYHINPSEIIKTSAEKINNREIIEKLARVKFEDKEIKGITVVGRNIKLSLDIANVIDVKKEKNKLEVEMMGLKNNIEGNTKLINNKDFMKKAPDMVKSRTMASIEYSKQILEIKKRLFNNLQEL